MSKKYKRRDYSSDMPSVEDLFECFLSLPQTKRDKEFWTVKQVAVLLNKHKSTIRQQVDAGTIPHIRVWGTIYIHLPSLKRQLIERSAA